MKLREQIDQLLTEGKTLTEAARIVFPLLVERLEWNRRVSNKSDAEYQKEIDNALVKALVRL
jgi:hypothetical protein